MEVITAVAAWAISTACRNIPASYDWVGCSYMYGIASRDIKSLQEKLSSSTEIHLPGSAAFDDASARWSALASPKITVVVVPATERDVAETVHFANELNVPFLAYSGAHGTITTLSKMRHGIEINLGKLKSIKVSPEDNMATIGGGAIVKDVLDELWAAGKQTVMGTCECVGFVGPALGGGHGWLQGHYGVIADQLLSMNVVLANGTLVTVDGNSELWWAMKGAGHNFGIVTSVTTTIYEAKHTDWAIETFIFSGDKVEEVYHAANQHLLKNGSQPVDVINWSYWLNNPQADPEKPIIIFYVIQEGVKAVDSLYTKPFHDIGPLSVQAADGDYRNLAAWTGVSADAPPCQKAGLSNPRWPLYLESYNVAAQKKAYDLFAKGTHATPFTNSIFMFEGYSTQGLRSVDAKSTAFAFREEHLLIAPLISYMPNGASRDKEAQQLGEQLRRIIHEGSHRNRMRSYVNYAYGDETPVEWYGDENWRQVRLRELKRKYDPEGRFGFFGPIAP